MAAVRPQILVIDDEPQIHRFLSPALDAAGYEPRRADSGQEGLRGIALWSPDAVVLDLGLPDMDGKDVLARAREFYSGPIIILSARDKEAEKIAALDLGADDYVEKPFGVGELLARVRANLRQAAPRVEASGPLTAGEVVIDLERRLITRAGEARGERHGIPPRLGRRVTDDDVAAHARTSSMTWEATRRPMRIAPSTCW